MPAASGASPGARGAVPPLGADDYTAVFKSRERAKSAHFSLHWRASPVAVSRFGMVVAKRLTRTAIRRNLVKRQARALFAAACPAAAAPLDVVLRLTRNPNEMAREAQYAELRGLFAALPAVTASSSSAPGHVA